MNRRDRGLLPLANPLEPKLLLSLAAPPWLGRGAPATRIPVFAHNNLPVNTLGLVIEGPRAEPALQDGHAALSISGMIRNVEDHPIVTPPASSRPRWITRPRASG